MRDTSPLRTAFAQRAGSARTLCAMVNQSRTWAVAVVHAVLAPA